MAKCGAVHCLARRRLLEGYEWKNRFDPRRCRRSPVTRSQWLITFTCSTMMGVCEYVESGIEELSSIWMGSRKEESLYSKMRALLFAKCQVLISHSFGLAAAFVCSIHDRSGATAEELWWTMWSSTLYLSHGRSTVLKANPLFICRIDQQFCRSRVYVALWWDTSLSTDAALVPLPVYGWLIWLYPFAHSRRLWWCSN